MSDTLLPVPSVDLLGMTGNQAPHQVRRRLPALEPDEIVMLGQRDELYRREIGVPSIADRVRLHPVEEVRRDPRKIARQAAEQLARGAPSWWLHIDLDVLDRSEFTACGAVSDQSMPRGLTWEQLATIMRSALHIGGCRGLSVGVYNPDLDTDGKEAR